MKNFTLHHNYGTTVLENATYIETGSYSGKSGYGTVVGTIVSGYVTNRLFQHTSTKYLKRGEKHTLFYIPKSAFDSGEYSHFTCG